VCSKKTVKMKVPKIFIPEKGLENNVKTLLSGKQAISRKHNIDFDILEIEPGARNKYSNRWYYTSFDKSVKLLKKQGYKRHLYPWESFELIINHLEGKLDEKLGIIAKNILASEGEWFSMAVKREGEILTCYVDPENIRWGKYDKQYVVDGVLKYGHKEELAIKSVPSQMWVGLECFSDYFVSFFYNRNFKELPAKMQEKSKIYLPPDDLLWPIGGGDWGLDICGYVSERISRGVKEKK
jgi:hypothetical protein